MGYKLSVIVSMYNASPYIERCLRSLLTQTLDCIEYIFVDDASTDDTLDIARRIMEEYPERSKDVRIVEQTENHGIADSRQRGLDMAQGEYIIYCDSDDWVDSGYYKAMYEVVKQTDADIVAGKYLIEYGDRAQTVEPRQFDTPEDFINNEKRMFLSLWSHMLRRKFLEDNDIRFFTGVNHSEDLGLMFRCYCLSERNAVYNGSEAYHYNKTNANALTARCANRQTIEYQARCLTLLEKFLQSKRLDGKRNGILLDEKFRVKESWLLLEPADYKQWRKARGNVLDLLRTQPTMSGSCKIAWILGQYIHPSLLRAYIGMAKKHKK